MNNITITRKVATGFIAGALAITLTACSSEEVPGVNVPVPGASDAPTVEASRSPSAEPSAEPSPEVSVEPIPFEDDNGFGFDSSTVTVPEDVAAVFGDTATDAVNDALTAIHVGYAEHPALVTPGYEQSAYDEAWDAHMQAYFTDAVRYDEGITDKRDYLLMNVNPDGVLGTIDGTEYVMPADGGVEVALLTSPILTLAESGDAAVVAFNVEITFLADPAHVTQEVRMDLTLVPTGEDGEWKIRGFAYEALPAVVVGG